MPSFATIVSTLALAGYSIAAPLGALPVVGDLTNTVEGVVPADLVNTIEGLVRRQLPVVGDVVNTVEGIVPADLVNTVEGIVRRQLAVVDDVTKTAEGTVPVDLVNTVEGVVGTVNSREAVSNSTSSNSTSSDSTSSNSTSSQGAATALPDVLNTLSGKLGPALAKLEQASPLNLQAVQPVAQEVTNILNEAMTSTQTLVGKPMNEVLATADGVMSLADVAKTVAPILSTVLGAANKVMSVTDDVKKEVGPAVSTVGAAGTQLVATMVQALGGGDLLSALAPIVGPASSLLSNLPGVSQVTGLLGIQL